MGNYWDEPSGWELLKKKIWGNQGLNKVQMNINDQTPQAGTTTAPSEPRPEDHPLWENAVNAVKRVGSGVGGVLDILTGLTRAPFSSVQDKLAAAGNWIQNVAEKTTGTSFPNQFDTGRTQADLNIAGQGARDVMQSLGAVPAVNPAASKARATVATPTTTPPVNNPPLDQLGFDRNAFAPGALTPQGGIPQNIPTIEESIDRLMKRNPNMSVNYNGQGIIRPANNQVGMQTRAGLEEPTSAGYMESIDPKTGEKTTILFSPPPKDKSMGELITTLSNRIANNSWMLNSPDLGYRQFVNNDIKTLNSLLGGAETTGKYGTSASPFGTVVEGEKVKSAGEIAKANIAAQSVMDVTKQTGENAKTLEEIKNRITAIPPGSQAWGKEGTVKMLGENINTPPAQQLETMKEEAASRKQRMDELFKASRDITNPNQKEDLAKYNAEVNKIQGQLSKPTLPQFITEIRKRGSKLSDAVLKQAYIERYGR